MPSTQDVINQDTINGIISRLSETLQKKHIYPDIAAEICSNLQSHLRKGEYNDISEGEFLAFVLTVHLQELNSDEHLWVRWHASPLPDHQGPLYQDESWEEKQHRESRLNNFGLRKVEYFPGNVGYLEIHQFARLAWGKETAIAAMKFLQNAEALIFDLRNCQGGFEDMSSFISSYLFDDEPVLLNKIHWREEDQSEEFWTTQDVPGPRFADKPVYILTSNKTISGGEAFAYNLKVLGRATIVGEKTNGSAHLGASFRLHKNFEAFIPIGYPINPISNSNWEGVGVEPDVNIPQEKALDTGYGFALEGIIAGLSSNSYENSETLLEEANSALEKLKLHNLSSSMNSTNEQF